MMTIKRVSAYTDVVFCLVLLPLLLFAFPVERWWAMHPVYFGLFVLWLYITYFVYRYYVVPGLFADRRRRVYALGVLLLSVIITCAFSTYEITSPYYHLRRQSEVLHIPVRVWGVRQSRQAVWMHYIEVVTFCFATGMLAEAFRQRMAREQAEYERGRAELALFKAQINPHFLFNTLNTIYGLLINHSPHTEPALERFIGLARYMYTCAAYEWVPLGEESDYIHRYIDLQKLRLNQMAQVDYAVSMDRPGQSVPPMLLITFVENAFKYGISAQDPCFVYVSLMQKGGRLHFEVENSVFQRQASPSAQLGIANCRRRLDLLYPGRYHLSTGISGKGTYQVILELSV